MIDSGISLEKKKQTLSLNTGVFSNYRVIAERGEPVFRGHCEALFAPDQPPRQGG